MDERAQLLESIKKKRASELEGEQERQSLMQSIRSKRDEVTGSGELASEAPRINNMSGSMSQFFKKKDDGSGMELAPQETQDERDLNQKRTGLRAKLSLARGRPEAERDIVLSEYPDALIEQDSDGNFLATIPELGAERQFLNEPGLSMRDADQTTVSAAALLPAGRAVGLASSVGGRMLISGGLAAAETVAQDAAVNQMAGTEISKSDAAMAFALGGVFEGIAPLAVNKVMETIRRRKGLDNIVAEEFARAGMDMDSLTLEQTKRLAEVAQKNPDEIIKAYGDEVSDSFGLPQTRLTREQTTGAASKEADIRNKRPDLFKEQDSANAEAIQASAVGVMNSLGPNGRRLGEDINSVGDVIGEGLRKAEQKSAKKVNKAYKKAGDVEAIFNAEPMKEFAQGLRGQFKKSDVDMAEFGGVSTTPTAKEAIERIEAEITPLLNSANPEISIENLEQMRKLMSNYRSNSEHGPDRRAMGMVMERFDNFYDDLTDEMLISGDPKAVDLMQAARARFAEHKGKFAENTFGKKKDRAGRIVEKIINDDLTGTQVTDLLFGRAAIGGKNDTAKAIKRIAKAAGKDSPAWQGLREGAVETLFRPDAAGGFNPERFLKDTGRAFGGRGKAVMDELFSTEERQMLMRFRQEITKHLPDYATNTAMGLNRFSDAVAMGMEKVLKRKAASAQLGTREYEATMWRMIPNMIDRWRAGKALNGGQALELNPRGGLGAALSGALSAGGVQHQDIAPNVQPLLDTLSGGEQEQQTPAPVQ